MHLYALVIILHLILQIELTSCDFLQWQLHAGRGEIFLQKMDAEAAALRGKFLWVGLLVVENIITWLECTQYAL